MDVIDAIPIALPNSVDLISVANRVQHHDYTVTFSLQSLPQRVSHPRAARALVKLLASCLHRFTSVQDAGPELTNAIRSSDLQDAEALVQRIGERGFPGADVA